LAQLPDFRARIAAPLININEIRSKVSQRQGERFLRCASENILAERSRCYPWRAQLKICDLQTIKVLTISSCAHESRFICVKLSVIRRSLIKSALGCSIDIMRHYDDNRRLFRYIGDASPFCEFQIDISYLVYTYICVLFNSIHSAFRILIYVRISRYPNAQLYDGLRTNFITACPK